MVGDNKLGYCGCRIQVLQLISESDLVRVKYCHMSSLPTGYGRVDKVKIQTSLRTAKLGSNDRALLEMFKTFYLL